jgi:hypothetical protein
MWIQRHAVFAAASLYVREFYRKGLFRLEACQRHYAAMSAEGLLAEAAWLFGAATESLPYPFVFRRYYALFEALTEQATCAPRLSRQDRVRLINAAIAAKEEMRRRAPPANREQLTRLVRDTCVRMGKMGCCKPASVLIRSCTEPVDVRQAFVHPASAVMQ